MSKFNTIGVIMLVVLLLFPLGAVLPQEQMPTLVLSIEDCLKFAAERSSEKEIIDRELESAELSYRATKLSYLLPEASLSLSTPGYSHVRDFYDLPPLGRTLYEATNYTHGASLNLAQNLYTGGRLQLSGNIDGYNSENNRDPEEIRETRTGVQITLTQPVLDFSGWGGELDQARLDLKSARIKSHQELMNLKKQVYQNYFDWIYARRELEIDRRRLARLELLVEAAREKWHAGLIKPDEYFNLQTEKSDLEVSLLEQENGLAELEVKILSMLEIDYPGQVQPSDHLDWQSLSSQLEIPKQLSPNASVQVTQARIDLEKKERALQEASRSGRISGDLSLNYSLLGRGDVPRQSFDTFEPNRWGVNLTFRVPIWDGGSNSSKVKSAEASYVASELELEREKKLFDLNYRSLVNRLSQQNRKIELYTRQLELSEENFGIAGRQREEGLISEESFLLAESDYLQAELNLFKARADEVLARLEILLLRLPDSL
jgi:outer membrane protein